MGDPEPDVDTPSSVHRQIEQLAAKGYLRLVAKPDADALWGTAPTDPRAVALRKRILRDRDELAERLLADES